MVEAAVVALGVAVGVLGAVPPALLFEQALRKARPVSVAAGLAGIMVSFVMLSVAVFVVWLTSRKDVLVFGTAEASSFLLVWVVEALRAWRGAQQGVAPRERNRGESTR